MSTTSDKSNGKHAASKKTIKKPAKKKSNKEKPPPKSDHYEEDCTESDEFDVDEDGNATDHPPDDKTKSSTSAELPARKLTPTELKSLIGHMTHCDEVYETAFSELDKTAYKKRTEWDYLWDDLFVEVPLQMVLSASRDLCDEGLKPSDTDFNARLNEGVMAIAEDPLEDVFGDDVPDCLKELHAMQGLSAAHGINLLQRQLRLHAHRVFDRHRPHQIIEASERLQQRLQQIEALAAPQYTLASERFDSVLAKIEQHRGKAFHGLRTGLDNLDERTRGLSGLVVTCAPPGWGKSTLTTEISIGVIRHIEENDCAVLILSLEMTEEEMVARMLSRLSGLPERVIYLGDDPMALKAMTPATRKKLDKAIKEYRKLSKRLLLVDAAQLESQPPTERQILAQVDHLKKQTGLSQVLVVVDYLQLMDVGGLDGLQADRHQFQQLQNVQHAGHTVLAISESRKPASTKDPWTTGLADVKGDGRLSYGASGVFLLRPMRGGEVARCYGLPSSYVKKGGGPTAALDQFLVKLDTEGKTPLCLHIDKMRAPGRRGLLYFEFQYEANRMKPLVLGCTSDLPPDDEDVADDGYEEEV